MTQLLEAARAWVQSVDHPHEEHLRALARIGDDLEQRLGGPQDIEWALEGGEIYVLQARPVTT